MCPRNIIFPLLKLASLKIKTKYFNMIPVIVWPLTQEIIVVEPKIDAKKN